MIRFYFKLLYQVSETIIERAWLKMAADEMDCNVKELS